MVSVFKDISKLSFDYVPKELPNREAQLKRLNTLFTPILSSNYSQNAFLAGSVGTGKTATAKLFCKQFRDAASRQGKAVDFVFVNCRHRSTDSSAMLKIIQHFDPHFPDRGFSLTEMLDILRKHIEKRGIHLVIVLDEADVLIKKNTNLVYNLSRFHEEHIKGKKSVSLLLISQRHILGKLDTASISTFKRSNQIEFGKYGQDELRDIVKQRVGLAFHPDVVEVDAIELISDIASEWGDARYAIELLEKAGMLADEGNKDMIGPEEVRGSKAVTHSFIDEEKLLELDRSKKMLLLAVARSLKRKAYVNTGTLESEYKAVCEEYDEHPKGHTQYWKYVKELDALGLITAKKSMGEGGTTTLVSLPDIPAGVLDDTLIKMM
jgi:cell division control protein 6